MPDDHYAHRATVLVTAPRREPCTPPRAWRRVRSSHHHAPPGGASVVSRFALVLRRSRTTGRSALVPSGLQATIWTPSDLAGASSRPGCHVSRRTRLRRRLASRPRGCRRPGRSASRAIGRRGGRRRISHCRFSRRRSLSGQFDSSGEVLHTPSAHSSFTSASNLTHTFYIKIPLQDIVTGSYSQLRWYIGSCRSLPMSQREPGIVCRGYLIRRFDFTAIAM